MALNTLKSNHLTQLGLKGLSCYRWWSLCAIRLFHFTSVGMSRLQSWQRSIRLLSTTLRKRKRLWLTVIGQSLDSMRFCG